MVRNTHCKTKSAAIAASHIGSTAVFRVIGAPLTIGAPLATEVHRAARAITGCGRSILRFEALEACLRLNLNDHDIVCRQQRVICERGELGGGRGTRAVGIVVKRSGT